MRTHITLPGTAAVWLLVSCAPAPDSALEANKELARQFVTVYNSGDYDRFDDFVMADMARHTKAGGEVHSLEEFKVDLWQTAQAFPDAREEILQIVAEGVESEAGVALTKVVLATINAEGGDYDLIPSIRIPGRESGRL